MRAKRMLAAMMVSLGGAGVAHAQPAPPPAASRGELLYAMHCIACHGAQMHWREKKLAVDWSSLQFQVNRWQLFSQLGWRKEDVDAVARYLNRLYYHYPGATATD